MEKWMAYAATVLIDTARMQSESHFLLVGYIRLLSRMSG